MSKRFLVHDEVKEVKKCRNCGEVVLIAFHSGYMDDRRAWHDNRHRELPAHLRGEAVCKKLEPVEIGRGGLEVLLQKRRVTTRYGT
jgi:ribosomal protein S27AE